MTFLKSIIIGLITLTLLGTVTFAENLDSKVKVGSDITVPVATAVDSVISVGGDVHVYGMVLEDAVSVGGDVIIYPGGNVAEDAISVGGSVINKGDSKIGGDTVTVDPFNLDAETWTHTVKPIRHWGYWMGGLASIAFLVLAVLVVLFVPSPVRQIQETLLDSGVQSLVWGLFGVILVIPTTIVLAISLVGIPLIPFFWIIIFAAKLFGYVCCSGILGQQVLNKIKRPSNSMMIQIIAGLVTLWFVGLIPIVGWLLKTGVTLCGFGAVLLLGWDRYRYRVN
ncbi:hypothetical protein HOH87_00265 [bacterium]|jgi:hypothetical protein|nr:hypothetical protein [bacterium]